MVYEECSFRWKSSGLYLTEAQIRCPRDGCDGEQVIQWPHDTESSPDDERPGITFTSAKHGGKSCNRPSWFVGKVISERQARRVFNALCGLPDCRCRVFALSSAALEEVKDSVPGLGRQFVVLPAQQRHEKSTRPSKPAAAQAAANRRFTGSTLRPVT